jgi:hypothetical protein
VRLLLEFESSGIIYPTARITVAEPDMYVTPLHMFRASLESTPPLSLLQLPSARCRACRPSRTAAVLCAGFLLWFAADEVYFFWHMKIGDYFSEFDRVLSLLLIAMLATVVGLRASFIVEYAGMALPITTVAGANALIYGVALLENEKQVSLPLPRVTVCRC